MYFFKIEAFIGFGTNTLLCILNIFTIFMDTVFYVSTIQTNWVCLSWWTFKTLRISVLWKMLYKTICWVYKFDWVEKLVTSRNIGHRLTILNICVFLSRWVGLVVYSISVRLSMLICILMNVCMGFGIGSEQKPFFIEWNG